MGVIITTHFLRGRENQPRVRTCHLRQSWSLEGQQRKGRARDTLATRGLGQQWGTQSGVMVDPVIPTLRKLRQEDYCCQSGLQDEFQHTHTCPIKEQRTFPGVENLYSQRHGHPTI